MALTILEVMPDAHRYDVRILASDIDPRIVESARRGVYSDTALEPVPKPLRERWTSSAGSGRSALAAEVRELVSFRELNLMAPWPMRGRFQGIFCRNVVIYFEAETQAQLWRRFGPLLSPDGRLYVGHSERVDEPGYQACGQTIYRHAGEGR